MPVVCGAPTFASMKTRLLNVNMMASVISMKRWIKHSAGISYLFFTSTTSALSL